MFGIERAAHRAGYFTTTVSLQSLDRPSIQAAVTRLSGQGVDGIVVIAAEALAVSALSHLSEVVPIVAVEAGPDYGPSLVAIDQRAGAKAATRHLLELGHRTVHHIAGPTDWHEAHQRMEAWRDTLVEADAQVTDALPGDWSPRSGYQLGGMLTDATDATAIFVANDQMALGVLRALHEAGRRVPEDVSVVGFDDIPEAAYFTPPLTTVRQDFLKMGEQGLARLLAAIEGDTSVRRELIEPELIIRASTAAPSV
jgi:DNA-binding LacI/PurR family transcriptional regulator